MNYPARWQHRIVGMLGMLGAIATFSQAIQAQTITPDQTLGAESSILLPNANVRGLPASLIQGGATRGVNLFHSFQDFNIGVGDRVYFANPVGIETILGRVTGGNLSRIFGTLGVDGNANLFLINPNGIVFGVDARLDIAGSFVASTANSLTFGNSLEFSATAPQPAPLLTMNVRPGLQYGTNSSATITNRGHLATGQDLTLAAGNLDLQGRLLAGRDLTLQALDTLTVRDSAVTPFLATAGGALTVQGERSVDIFALSHPASGFFSGGNLVLRSANPISIDAHFQAGGSFRAEQLDGTPVGLISLYDPVFEVAGDFVAPGPYNGASLQILAGGNVFLGDVTITGPSALFNNSTVTLSDGTLLNITGTAVPILDVRAGQTAFFGLPTPGIITGSDVVVAGTITIAPGGGVFLTNFNPAIPSQGVIITDAINSPGGEVVLDSTNGIAVAGVINLSNINGLGGDVTLLGGNGDILFTAGSGINSTGVLGGNIRIETAGRFSATQGGIASFSIGPAPGLRGGDIFIDVGSMFLDNSIIETSTIPLALLQLNSPQVLAEADAGNITIRARDEITLSNTSLVRGLIRSGGIGKAADVDIQARSLFVTGGSQIGSGFFREQTQVGTGVFFPGGQGSPGNITINAIDQIFLSGINQNGFSSGLIAGTERGASGVAGDVTVNIPTGVLQIQEGAIIATLTRNPSAGGNVFIDAGAVELFTGGKILANTDGGGAGGEIDIRADRITIDGVDPNFGARLLLIDNYLRTQAPSDTLADVFGGIVNSNSGLFANTDGRGTTDSITLNAREITVSNAGVISSDTGASGNAPAGNIIIGNPTTPVASLNVLSGGNIVSRTFGGGVGGDIIVNATSVFLSGVATFPFLFDGTEFLPTALLQTYGLQRSIGGYSSGIGVNAEDGSTGAGGFLRINADTLRMEDGSVLSARTRGTGAGGDILVNVQNLTLLGGAQMTAPTFGNVLNPSIGGGLPGNIVVRARGNVLLAGSDPTFDARFLAVQSAWQQQIDEGLVAPLITANQLARFTVDPVNEVTGIQARVESGAIVAPPANSNTSNGFIFLLVDGDLTMQDRALVSTSTLGQGDAGNVWVGVDGDITLSQGSQIRSAVIGSINNGVIRRAIGNAGNVVVGANSLDTTEFLQGSGSLTLDDFSSIATSTAGRGDGGNILIAVAGDIEINNSSTIRGTVEQLGIGNGGNISVFGRSLSLLNGGQIQAGIFRAEFDPTGAITIPGGFAPNGAGNIEITTTDFVNIAGVGNQASGLFVSTEEGAFGDAGSITVNTQTLSLANLGVITAVTRNLSNAGDINLNVTDRLSFQNRASVVVSGTNPQNLSDTNIGNPGNININAGEIVFFGSRSGIRATTASADQANRANINLNVAGSILLLPLGGQISQNNEITAEAFNQGAGGNISINALAVLTNLGDNNDVVANAFGGNGGNITGNIAIVRLFRQFDQTIGRTIQSDFIASSELGIDGTVSVQTQNLTEFPVLPANLVDRSSLISQGCKPGAREIAGEFTVTGRGGLPTNPTQPLDSETILADWVALAENEQPVAPSAQTPVKTSPDEIVEAQGWITDEQGNITLIAQVSSIVPENTPLRLAPVCSNK